MSADDGLIRGLAQRFARYELETGTYVDSLVTTSRVETVVVTVFTRRKDGDDRLYEVMAFYTTDGFFLAERECLMGV